jgi:hypothetical protein
MHRSYAIHIAPYLVVLAVASLAALRPLPAVSQGVAQVSLSGIPPVLASPLIADQARYLAEGRYQMQFVYTSSDMQPTDFVFRLSLERDGQVLLDLESEPTEFTRGVYLYASFDGEPPIVFPYTYAEIIQSLSSALDQDVEQTGVLSEGDYVLTVEPTVVDPSNPVITVPGLAPFQVRLLDPPMLLGPWEDAVVTEGIPVFSWLPISGASAEAMFEYVFVMAEVMPGQTPLQALEGNIPRVERVLPTAQTTFAYTGEELPLLDGRSYVWQIEARDVNDELPLSDDGRSELQTFLYSAPVTSMLEWEFTLSNPPVYFRLTDAERTSEGFEVDGIYRGISGGIDVEATFADVLLEPETLALLAGSVVLEQPLEHRQGVIRASAGATVVPDSTPPSPPDIAAVVESAGGRRSVQVIIGPSHDVETGIADVAVGLRSAADAMQIYPDTSTGVSWSVISTLPAGINGQLPEFAGLVHAIRLPANSSGPLDIRVRVRNGVGMETVSDWRVDPERDLSPPLLAMPEVNYRGYYDRQAPNRAILGETTAVDYESGIRAVEYRIVDASRPGEVVRDWTPIAGVRSGRNVTIPVTEIELPPFETDRELFVEIMAVNGANLKRVVQQPLRVDLDETGPTLTGILARYNEIASEPGVEVFVGGITDTDTGIRDVRVRVVDGTRTDRMILNWRSVSPSETYVISRSDLPFSARRPVRIDVAATNGAGLREVFSEQILVPATVAPDATPPLRPSLAASLVTRGDAGGTAQIEFRVGPTADLQTGIARVDYRLEDGADGSVLRNWTALAGIQNGAFIGARDIVSFPSPEDPLTVRVIVRVTNGAGVASTTFQEVVVGSEDVTPPTIESLQIYFQSGQLLVFVDGMSDTESFIEGAEYRLLDNATGAVVVDWTEYPILQKGRATYGPQLHRITPPPAAGRRAYKIEVRVTNGTGLQATIDGVVEAQ